MKAVAPAIIIAIAACTGLMSRAWSAPTGNPVGGGHAPDWALCCVPQLQAQEPPPAPAAGEPAAQPPVVSPGKAKGAWKGEYPLPKPPLPEGPAPSACPAAEGEEGAGAPGAAACPGTEDAAPH